MKLNYDCLRSLLLELEEFENIDENLNYQSMTLDDMINAQIMNADISIYMCIYSSLTYDGHQFLDNVRSNSIWSKTKSIAKKLGCTSLNSLMSIAGKIALDVIQSQL